MRKLMWFSIGFAAACAVGVYLYCGNWLLLLSLFCFAAALGTFAVSSKKGRIVRAVCFGCAFAFLWVWLHDRTYLSNARDADGQTVDAVVEITDYSSPTDYGIVADGRIQLEEKSYRIRLYSYDPAQLSPGDRVEGQVRLHYTAGEDSRVSYHSGIGIFLIGYAKETTVISAKQIALRDYPAVLRARIVAGLQTLFPQDTEAFARALLLGDKTGLDYETNTALSVSGIRHVVAVSGLHVSILVSVLISLLGYRRFVTPIVGWILLALFAAVTGFTPSVVRACVMQALILGSLMAQKEYDPPTALAFAVLVMLLTNPLAITGVGLQLSAGCVIGILLFSAKIQAFLLDPKCLGKASAKTFVGKLKRGFVSTVSITLSTWITTTPLCSLYFGTVSLIGILTNLLTLWAVTVIFCGIIAALIAGLIYAPVGSFIAWVISWLIRYVLLVADVLASFPLAAIYTASPYTVVWIVLCYVLLAVFMVSKKHPWVMISCMLLGLLANVSASWLEPKLDSYRFTVLDVGQGQCILVQWQDRHYVIDCGGDHSESVADLAVQTLLSQGVTELDGVILTHYDEDHAGGAALLLSRIPADTIYLPDVQDTGNVRKILTDAYADSVYWIMPQDVLKIPDGKLTIFAAGEGKSDNESSLCVLFQPENCDILITGDRGVAGERALLQQADLPDLEVLVVGHHGASNAAGMELLAATTPELAVISVGEHNNYSHPSQEVLERLALFGCAVKRTDVDGTIVIRG